MQGKFALRKITSRDHQQGKLSLFPKEEMCFPRESDRKTLIICIDCKYSVSISNGSFKLSFKTAYLATR